MFLKLLSGAIAANSPPSGATAGFPLRGRVPGTSEQYWRGQNDGVLLVKSTAGSGTMTVTCRVWGYSPRTSSWHPLGTSATESSRGVLNEQGSIDEDGADTLVHAETITGLAAFTRIYLEVVSIGGTDTAIDAYLENVEEC